MKYSFDITDTKYVLKQDVKDFIAVDVSISSDSEYLPEEKTFNIGKTERFFDGDDIDMSVLRSKVDDLIQDEMDRRRQLRGQSKDSYNKNTGDAGKELAESSSLDVEMR